MNFRNAKLRKIILIIGIFTIKNSVCSGQFNWLRPYDTLLVPDQLVCSGLQLTGYAEFGVKDATGYDVFGNPVNVLQIWNCNQDALSMLDGFDANSNIGQKNIIIDATNDGVRGHFAVTGDLQQKWAFALAARYFFWENLCLSFYLPFYHLQLKNVCWRDLTQDVTADDIRVKENLTNDFFSNVCQLGNGLALSGWNRKGPGDLATFIEFFKDFPQNRPMLKNVGLHGRVGFNIPTGKKQNENEIFAVPFGYDGAAGFFGGAGIDILLANVLQLGVDVELLHLFGNTQERRIKTDINQTELLLLAKLCAYKEYGLIQRFNLYAQILNLCGPFSFKLGYQFFKQDDNQLSFSNCQFSSNVANTALSLQEWTMHHFYTIATYDFCWNKPQTKWYNPYISVYARIPMRGKNIAMIPTIGAVFALTF